MNISTHPHPTLDIARLHLRGLQPTDADAIFALRSSESVNAHLDRKPAATLDDAVNFINNIAQMNSKGDGLYWGITLKDNGQLIGTICLYNFDREKDIAEAGYELLPEFQGQGLMLEAVKAVVDYSLETIRVKVITAFPRVDNQSSVKLLEKAGFSADKAYAYLNGPDEEGRYLTYVLKSE